MIKKDEEFGLITREIGVSLLCVCVCVCVCYSSNWFPWCGPAFVAAAAANTGCSVYGSSKHAHLSWYTKHQTFGMLLEVIHLGVDCESWLSSFQALKGLMCIQFRTVYTLCVCVSCSCMCVCSLLLGNPYLKGPYLLAKDI